jgi:DNA uptake protein ComE-like DNA-binding protein
MTPAKPNDPQLAPRGPQSGNRPVLRQVLWAAIPVVSIGFLSFVPFLGYAIMSRRPRDWAVFAAYLAATVALMVAAGTGGHGGGATAVGWFVIALAGCAAVHSAVLFRPGSAPSVGRPAVSLGPRERNRDAVASAKSRIERRKDARHLAETDPALARDLGIGRPDLRRDYDDGGLVDVNHAPRAVLSSVLGLKPGEVSDVMAARDKLGRFTSADELCAYTELSPDRVDELRDLMIFS